MFFNFRIIFNEPAMVLQYSILYDMAGGDCSYDFFLDFTSMEKEYSIIYDQSSITTLSLMYLKLLFVVD